MTDYRAIDVDKLTDELADMVEAVQDAQTLSEVDNVIDDHVANINGIIRSFDDPIEIRDRDDGFHVIVMDT